MRTLIDRVGANVQDLEHVDKKRILELLQVRVEIVGESKSGQKGGTKDPMLEWHRENEIDIPLAVSDEQWARVEGILAGGRKPKPEDRACFEMLLEKLRDTRAGTTTTATSAWAGRAGASSTVSVAAGSRTACTRLPWRPSARTRGCST